MHMSDALVSSPVALTGSMVAAGLLAIAGSKIKKEENSSIVPLMGVLGAFVFAAQMINFAIPGTGSSGHIIGGVLLAAFLGPWAAFITLTSVLLIQCLVFADGGLLALGCNILNMGVTTTLIAYPLIFKPIAGRSRNVWRISLAAVIACIIGLELGACFVTLETVLSGVSALKWSQFLGIMALIHLPIGFCEGLATAAVVGFVSKNRPSLLQFEKLKPTKKYILKAALYFGIATFVIGGGGLVWFASSNPDGLEWSIYQLTGNEEIEALNPSDISLAFGRFANTTSLLPDYENPLSGIIGAVLVLLIVWIITTLIVRATNRKKSSGIHEEHAFDERRNKE